MRLDVIFYVLGIVCFIFAVLIIPLLGVTLLPVAFLIVLLLFGLLFTAFGYSTRPRHYRIIRPPPLPKPAETKTEEKPPAPPEIPPAPTVSTPAPSRPQIKLTRIKGIGPKRMAQLNALQIMSAEDLAKFSAAELADKLKVSSKITAKWIEQAQDLMKKDIRGRVRF